jgi:DNA (cytosine-5)-methyltransferase 1
MALDRLNIDYEHYKISEWNVFANASYNIIHNKDKTNYDESLSNEEIIEKLYDLQITIDDKKSMTKEDIQKKGEKWYRKIYNEFMQNHNVGSITNIHANDLNIVDTNKYNYLFTYSFPCVDLSMSGKLSGMKKGSGTRSGLLWEIERIFNEIIDNKLELPQILFMENVKQVISKRNKADFDEWCHYLESIGYTNSYQVLNSCEYGNVAQNRERCYMISILGDIKYKFPPKIELTKYLRDYLDDINIEANKSLYINNIYANECKEKYKDIDFFASNERYNKIVSIGNYMKSHYDSSNIVNINGICPTVKENHNTVTAIIDQTGNVRKLSVTEFGRLMGVNEDDIKKILSIQSKSKARKQFGNSIVVDVMVNIFNSLFTNEYLK